MTATTLFVTGMQRSGTTLLDKLLCSHPRICLLSQPFPLLFVEAKRGFLAAIGEPRVRYPLGPLFLENRYQVEDLSSYLGRYRIDGETLLTWFESMAEFSGQYTRFARDGVRSVVDGHSPGAFASTIAQLYRGFASKSADLFGGKETICEEFLPHFLDEGWKCLIVLRDPRDTLASLNYGRGPEYSGRLKPTLFNLRNWRKSVAFALHLERNPNFAWVRYEDLVARPVRCLNRIAKTLGVALFNAEHFAEGIRDQSGDVWEGNSSHTRRVGIDKSSIGSHKKLLPEEVRDYVEATCFAEMRSLGYEVSISWAEVTRIISSFKDPYRIARKELLSYVDEPSRVDEELERVRLLRRPATRLTRPYFLFRDVHETLRRKGLPDGDV